MRLQNPAFSRRVPGERGAAAGRGEARRPGRPRPAAAPAAASADTDSPGPAGSRQREPRLQQGAKNRNPQTSGNNFLTLMPPIAPPRMYVFIHKYIYINICKTSSR